MEFMRDYRNHDKFSDNPQLIDCRTGEVLKFPFKVCVYGSLGPADDESVYMLGVGEVIGVVGKYQKVVRLEDETAKGGEVLLLSNECRINYPVTPEEQDYVRDNSKRLMRPSFFVRLIDSEFN